MRKTTLLDQYELLIDIKKDQDWYIASCPSWADCYAQGNTLDDAVFEITSVAQSLIELYREKSLKVPLKLLKTFDYSKSLSIKSSLLIPSL